MNRDAILDAAKRRLYDAAPEMTGYVADEIIKAPRFQQWADRVERERSRGLIARWRRIFGKRGGLSDEHQEQLERIVRDALNARRAR